jgi:hypothetical protein
VLSAFSLFFFRGGNLMNRRDFIKVAIAGFGTVLASGAAINMLNTKPVPETAPVAEAAPQAAYDLGHSL